MPPQSILPDRGRWVKPLPRPRSDRAQAQQLPPQSTQLAQMILDDPSISFFFDPTGAVYARFPGAKRREVAEVSSLEFSQWGADRFYGLAGMVPSETARRAALGVVEAEARQRGEVWPVFIRVGQEGEVIYCDLADDAGRVIEVTVSGWRVIVDPDVPLFLRSRAMEPLPVPEPGERLDQLLQPLVNVGPEELYLICFWLLAVARPQGPLPVLVLTGEPGAGKSTTARLLRWLLDPRRPDLLAEPRDVRDLMVIARRSWVLAFDNLSRVDPWLSDALCRLSTGGGFSTRRLFTDADEAIFDAVRPVILTSIGDVVARSDLLDRSLVLRLPPIPDSQRRTEADFWRDAAALRPRVLGAVLDAVAVALQRVSSVSRWGLPRMADFCVWSLAAAPALGLTEDQALAVLLRARDEAVGMALEGDPVSETVMALVEAHEDWVGTASDLLDEMRARVPKEKRDRGFPETPRAVANQLRRVAPALRASGIDVNSQRRGHERRRTIVLRRTGAPASTPGDQSYRPDIASDHEGQRIFTHALAESLGWPQLRLGSGRAVAAGERAWAAFITEAPREDIEAAVAALMAIDERERTEEG